jgi:hypothetical protein
MFSKTSLLPQLMFSDLAPPFHNSCCGFSSSLNYNHNKNHVNSCCGSSSSLNYNHDKNHGTEGVQIKHKLSHSDQSAALLPPSTASVASLGFFTRKLGRVSSVFLATQRLVGIRIVDNGTSIGSDSGTGPLRLTRQSPLLSACLKTLARLHL